MGEPDETLLTLELVFENKLGLHARCATKIVQTIQEYDCQVNITREGRTAPADSILSLLTLNCPRGARVSVEACGNDSKTCLDDLSRLFARKFDED